MPQNPGATTGEVIPAAKDQKVIIAPGDANTARIAQVGAEPESVQSQAIHKMLQEAHPGAPRILPVLLPAAAPAEPAAPAESLTSPAANRQLDHHDASFFQRDLLHGTERVANVWSNSFSKYLAKGVAEAGRENLETGEWVQKAESGMFIGIAMRTLLPKKGVVRAVAGTVMAINMAKDLVVPFYDGAVDAVKAKDDKDLDDASRRVSKSVGNFVVDSAIGLPAAGVGEALTGRALEIGAPGFEAKKTQFWTSDKSRVGNFLNRTADNVDAVTARATERIKPTDPDVLLRETERRAAANLSPEEKARKLEAAGQEARAHVERSEFYRVGPKSDQPTPVNPVSSLGVPDAEKPLSFGALNRLHAAEGEPLTVSSNDALAKPAAPRVSVQGGLSFGQYIDHLEQGVVPGTTMPTIDIAASLKHAQGYLGEPQGIIGPIRPGDLTGRPPGLDVAISPDHMGDADGPGLAKGRRKTGGGSDTHRKPGKSKTDGADRDTDRTTEKKPAKDSTTGTEGATVSSPKDDMQATVFAKVAAVAKAVQELWTPEKIKLADTRDQFLGPINATTELTKAPLPPEYKPSTGQLTDLISQMDSAKNLKAAGMLLMYHMRAANQLLFPQDNVRDLNMFTNELAGVFLKGMRKLNVPEDRLRRIIPSLVTETNDNGSGYFTLPPTDGVVDRPVTVAPRAFSRLISVMTDVLRHEALGHDHTYPELARFPEADRDNLIRGAVAKTMKEEKIPEKMHKMGDETIPTSELMFRLLKAEANENTSDFMGTVSGGPGTAVSLGVLLQSLRDGGLLETRNVYGKEFEDGIEPHGIDRWRIKFCAEIMRQMAPGDKTVTEYADSLDHYAKESSRAGDNYVWASTDTPGQKIEIPMQDWDAVIPRIVKAQLDTPLDTLKDVNGKKHTMREMLGDGYAENVRGIDSLANQFTDAVRDGKTELPNFDKSKYTIGQVFSAGLVAWMRSTRHDVDPVESLKAIDKISSSLRALYRESNPNEVPLTTPTSVRIRQTLSQSPAQILRSTGAAITDKAPALRTITDKGAILIGGTAAGDVNSGAQWLYKEAHEMAQKTRELFGSTQPTETAPVPVPPQQ